MKEAARTQKIFGTDGVRGKVGKDPITVEAFLALGQAIGYYFSHQKPTRRLRHRILIGKDTRMSNYMLEQSFSAGVCSVGADSMLLGPVPTPGLSFLTQSMRADAGVVISASHNRYEFNGLKVFDYRGEKMTDAQEEEISKLFYRFYDNAEEMKYNKVGKCKRLEDVFGRYVVHLKYFLPDEISLDGLRVLLDCAHGATYRVAPITFDELGCDTTCVGDEPNGTNINAGFGSTHIETLKHEMGKEKHAYDIGFAFDGDGDRCLMASPEGHVFDGDRITAMMAYYQCKHLRLKPPSIVLTEMSNTGLIQFLRDLGCDVRIVTVGDRNIRQEMVKKPAFLGSEPSGHIIFGDQFNTGDGILTAINVLRAYADLEEPLERLFHLYPHYPSVLLNIDVSQKPPIESLSKSYSLIKRIEKDMGLKGKVLVRYSGTEPVLRILVEGADKDRIENLASDIAQTVRGEINTSTP